MSSDLDGNCPDCDGRGVLVDDYLKPVCKKCKGTGEVDDDVR